jgi:hypothetical protein
VPQAGAPAAREARVAPSPAPQLAPSTPEAAGRFHIHVASVRREADVPDEYARLARLYPVIGRYPMQPTQRIEVTGQGEFWRVLAGTFETREAAAEVCRSVHALGAQCRIVAR